MSSVSRCHLFRCADLGNTYHRLVFAETHLKLKCLKAEQCVSMLNLHNLNAPAIKKWFAVEIINSFRNQSQLLGIKVMWWPFRIKAIDEARITFGLQYRLKIHGCHRRLWISSNSEGRLDYKGDISKLSGMNWYIEISSYSLTTNRLLKRSCHVEGHWGSVQTLTRPHLPVCSTNKKHIIGRQGAPWKHNIQPFKVDWALLVTAE